MLSRSYIGAVERGRVNPTLDKLKLIAERLGKPVSFFVPDEQELLSDRLEAMLNQARALVGAKEWTQAKALFDECQQACSQVVRPCVRALYLEVRAEIELYGAGVLKAVDSYKAAAQAYKDASLTASAWKCLYTSAMQLYLANHVSYASFVALKTLETIEPDEGLVDELAKTHYLIGCCYAALGNSTGASEHFSQEDVEEWEHLKDNWAITKCSLLRNPDEVMKVVSLFSQSFIKLARYRDAADVLSFGAELLEQQGRPKEALELMKAACDLYKRRPQ